jgi:enoyl-CoA hydratase/carnithine racemase
VDISDFTRMTVDVEAGVATITFNRPDLRNVWAGPTSLEYRWALHWCHSNPDVRVVVVTGERDFCVGADMKMLDDIGQAGGSYEVRRRTVPDYPASTPAQFRHNHFYPLTISTPVIAAIEGGCAGAGFLVASYADFRFADPAARIASSFAGLGLPAEYGIGWLLPRMVGVARAAQLLYSPEPIGAERAAELGWVQQVSQPGDVVAEAVRYGRSLASGSSAESLRMMKRQLFVDSAFDYGESYRTSVEEMNSALGGSDFKVGLRAARNKVRPDFLAPGRSADGVKRPAE